MVFKNLLTLACPRRGQPLRSMESTKEDCLRQSSPSSTNSRLLVRFVEPRAHPYGGSHSMRPIACRSPDPRATCRSCAGLPRYQWLHGAACGLHCMRPSSAYRLPLKERAVSAQAFLDFNGCMALTCSRTGCGCAFCAVCQQARPPSSSSALAIHSHHAEKSSFVSKSFFDWLSLCLQGAEPCGNGCTLKSTCLLQNYTTRLASLY